MGADDGQAVRREGLVHLPALIALAYKDIDRSRARMAICRGEVYIDGVCMALPDMDVDRARLRGALIHVGTRRPPFQIDAEGRKILRRHPPKSSKPEDPQLGLT